MSSANKGLKWVNSHHSVQLPHSTCLLCYTNKVSSILVRNRLSHLNLEKVISRQILFFSLTKLFLLEDVFQKPAIPCET